ncbi:iron-containing alcohol dehydrogenase [Planctomycetales bacterium ZRK34]|nr:iron-containing alcohol dehydrogenase [Planctomycetales bacterium ZRK34]
MIEFPDSGPRVITGANTVERVGAMARELGGRRALLVTDRHIAAAGHVDRAVQSLKAADIDVTVFDAVRENPTTEDVDACLTVAQEANVDVILGFGGGSSLDTAKGCNFLLTNGGRMRDYWGVGKATKPMLPLIAIPTTAGTGSECQSFALIADPDTHQKMACGDRKALPAIALLDPTLTLTQPRHVTANTAVDALTHAVETAVTLKRTEVSLRYSHEAFRLINEHLPCVFESPDDVDARGALQRAAACAGTAIEHSMLGAAHAAANPLTAHFNIIHGQAVGLMLPAVVRFNAADATTAELYTALANAAGLADIDALLDRLDALLDLADMPRSLDAVNIPRDAIATLATDAAAQWTANFNPRPVTADDFVALYEATFDARAPQPDG